MSAMTLAQSLARLAAAADRAGDGSVPALLDECLTRCADVATGASTAQRADVQQRLTVWRDVWPRLGKDPQFRAAVAREARRWSAQCGGGRDPLT